MSKRHKPLTADVIYIYDTGSSEYPETVKILMDDGHYITYHAEIRQPAPVLRESLEKFDNACCVGGYKYKEKGLGKRTGKKGENG